MPDPRISDAELANINAVRIRCHMCKQGSNN